MTYQKRGKALKPLNIFLLIGQSNMAGRGRLDDVPKLEHPHVFMFREGRWITALEPLHTDKPQIAGIGLAMSFAVELNRAADITPIGLVPCAVGGTPLTRWMPGADLYESAVRTARSALSAGHLTGILWHQGENDSGNRMDAASYGERLRNMIQNLRADLSAESVPVVAGELGHFLQHCESCHFFELVNMQLRQLEDGLSRYACVSSEGMKDNGDALHFDAASLREFGIRYAKRFLELKERNQLGEQPPASYSCSAQNQEVGR